MSITAGIRQLSTSRAGQAASKTMGKVGGFAAQGVALSVIDAPLQALQSYDPEGGQPNLALTALFTIPGMLMGGPIGLVAGYAISKIPEIPALIRGTNRFLNQQASYRRQSALPFGGYNWTPTAGAIESMNRGLNAMGSASNLTSTHAGLASMALRR